MSSDLILIYAAIAGVVLLGALVGLWWMNRDPHVERNASGVVPLFAGTSLPTEDATAEGVMSGGAVRRQEPFEKRPAAPTPAPHASDTDEAWPPTPYRPPLIRSFTTAVPTRDAQVSPMAKGRDASPTDGALSAPGAAADLYADTAVERQLLRFSPPVEGTLQFLPGRLLVVSGQEAGRELRFVRLPGPNGTEITFGRNEGELYRHIQLRDQTVSRLHASLRFADGRWYLRNLSQTNPVMLDGLSVASGTEHALDDGARIEMGEVLFSFRNR